MPSQACSWRSSRKFFVCSQSCVLFLRIDNGEVVAQRGDAGDVLRLQSSDGSKALTFGNALRSFDPRPPRQLVPGIEPVKRGKARIPAEASREGTAGPYEWRVTGERPEEAVDEVDDAGFSGAGILIGGDQAGARGLHDRVLVLVKESGHGRV